MVIFFSLLIFRLYIFSLSFPGVVFFSYHSYRMANYLIPLTCVGVIGCVLFWRQKSFQPTIFFLQKGTVFIQFCIPLIMTFLYYWFLPSSQWMSKIFIVSVWGLFFVSYGLHILFKNQKPWLWSLCFCPTFLTINLILCQVAEKEFGDLNDFITQNKIEI